ncbi:hypothetical protein SAMN04488589_0506 [Methanolobus vulcani]|uniref:Uncharacterized protein n=2 Tax=Methanolobus vulcani TaxID=38026 RepID=A0A7Z7FBV4_9EURY|nr:hypothetical protein SAMN04488589_0506 [Methanolobus vulcani]
MDMSRLICPKCGSKMVSAYIQKRIDGKLSTPKIGHYCQACTYFEPLKDDESS